MVIVNSVVYVREYLGGTESDPYAQFPAQQIIMRNLSMKRNKDILDRTYSRSERTIRTNGDWYYMTREGPTVGPFIDKNTA